ncbi:hypothetical protein EYC80_002209 [Monilinia laxa]|uniref:SMP-30/Gluconolactonase/LRE-like region domain-containing protein n=1 Tax=Monilinia laxa TaxID=61186 RepID=A0A5N6K339_MONLA|nr:hypothetical protein EYC80_002209 [Monilinia laxa]
MKISPLPFQIPLLFTTQAANIFLKTIYQFPEPVHIENIHIENIHTRENGQLLLSTFANGTLFTIDPTVPNASATPIITLSHEPGYALTGIASLGNNQYAISGGIHSPTAFSFQNNSMNIHVISLPAGAADDAHPSAGALLATIPIANPHAQLLNGMAALPASPWIILSAESLCGCIYRIDTRTHDHDIVFSSAEFASMDPAMPMGINGLRIRGSWLYFTNSGRGIFGRVEIDGRGERVGDVEVVASLRDMVGAGVGVGAGAEEFYDDFTLDGRGNAYVALHPHSVVRIAPDGGQVVVVGGGNSTFLLEPTALSTSRDGKSVYVVTGGAKMGSKGGQVIQILI